MNIGEEIVSVYLQYIKDCEFIQKNLYLPDVQGEIDIVGINLKTKEVYICEVAIHLITGIQYVKNGRIINVEKIVEKFSKDIEYANKYFKDYKKHFMFWSPIVKDQSQKAKHNQMEDMKQIQASLKEKYRKYSIEIELIINDRFLSCLKELRDYARKETKESKSPVLRLMQVEEYLKKHVEKLEKSGSGRTLGKIKRR